MKYFFLVFVLSTSLCIGQTSLKVCSWNLYCFPVFLKNVDNIERIGHITESLEDSNNDILCFQEVFSKKAKAILIKSLSAEFPYYATTNHSLSFCKINSGLIIFSKYPIINKSQIIFKNKFGIDAMARKGALQITISKEGKLFNVINTHLQNCGNLRLKFMQLNELKTLFSNECTNILAGDFNIDYYSTEYKLLESEFELRNSTFQKNIQYSYNSLKNSLIKNKNESPQLIDYILWKPIGNDFDSTHHVIKEFNHNKYKHNNLSDHFAVEATFYYPSHSPLKTAYFK